MQAKQMFRKIAAVLTLSTVIVGGAETTEKSEGAKSLPAGRANDAAQAFGANGNPNQNVPEPSAALVGAIGLLLLLGRRCQGQSRS
jgi:hypothetical protein